MGGAVNRGRSHFVSGGFVRDVHIFDTVYIHIFYHHRVRCVCVNLHVFVSFPPCGWREQKGGEQNRSGRGRGGGLEGWGRADVGAGRRVPKAPRGDSIPLGLELQREWGWGARRFRPSLAPLLFLSRTSYFFFKERRRSSLIFL